MIDPFRITPVYDLLLRGTRQRPFGLYHLQLATAAQLCHLHYSPGSIKAVKARLKVLADHGYVQADGIPTKFFKSPYYYTLGAKGMRYLEAAGFDTHAAWRAGKEVDKHALFITHTLELNDLVIAAALLGQTDARYHLDSFTHERALKRQPYKTKGFTIIPDAFLDFRLTLADGRQRRLPLLLEHDRGTEEQDHFRRRIRAYIAFLKAEAHAELFGTRKITVAFTTFEGEKRLEQMRAWTRAELYETGEPHTIGLSFCFAALTPPLDPRRVWLEPRWHTPYEGGEASGLLAL